MSQIVWSAIATICWVAGLCFLRFWSSARDRLFMFFAIAFWMLSLNWFYLAVVNPPVETHHYVYFLRFAAFAVIIAGIVDKNRRASKRAEPDTARGSRAGGALAG